VIGSQPGGFIAIALRTKNVREAAKALAGKVTFMTPIPESGPVAKVQFLDPDGYVLELFE